MRKAASGRNACEIPLRPENGALTLLATDGSPAQELSESDYGGMDRQISGCTRYGIDPASFPGADS